PGMVGTVTSRWSCSPSPCWRPSVTMRTARHPQKRCCGRHGAFRARPLYLLIPRWCGSGRDEHGLALQEHPDGLIGVDAVAGCGADDGAAGGEEVGSPDRAEA